jgi:hypothetical protein
LIDSYSKYFLRCCFAVAILISFPGLSNAASGPANSDASNSNSGSLHGRVLGEEGSSPARTQVIVRSGNGDFREVVATDSAGSYAVTALSPGRYEVAATDGGAVAKVDVVAGADTLADLVLQAPASSASPVPPSTPAPAPLFKPTDGFFTRWGKAYMADWTGTTPSDPNAPQRRGTPPPISSPPFPAGDWPIGGTQEIGAPDYQSYMLQEAIDKSSTKLSKVKWYGWVSIGGNGSTNNRGNASKGIPANSPSAYDEFPNTIVLDQLALYTEKLADTTQTDHFD